MAWTNPSSGEQQAILRETRTVAMVGASPNPARPSNRVAAYLLSSSSYEVWFVNPNAEEILGRPVYPSLADLPGVPDLVDVFRRREHLSSVVDAVLALPSRPRTLWFQMGLYDEALARRAEAGGLQVVMDRCIAVEHRRFSEDLPAGAGNVAPPTRVAPVAATNRRGD